MDFEGEGPGADGGACRDFAERLGRSLADGEPPDPAGVDPAAGHERECPGCEALAGLIDALAEVPPLESSDLVRRALESHSASLRRRRVRLAAFAAGGLAAAAALLVALLPAAPAPVPGVTRGAGSRPAAVTEGPARLSGLGGVAVGLGAGARAAVTGLDRERAECAIESGRVAFLIPRGAASSIDVGAGSAKVLLAAPGRSAGGAGVTEGTIAMIEVAGAEVTVDVVSGSAVFVLDGAGGQRREIALAAGQGAGTARAGLVPIDEDRRRLAMDLLGLEPAVAGKVALEETAADEVPEETAEGATASDAGHRADKDDGREDPGAGDDRRRGGAQGKAAAPPPGELIALAREQRAAGNWSAAADLYRQVLDGHPSRPEATAVLVPLAELELEHLRRPDLALRHFGLYVGKLPGGPLGEEALWGRCQALRALGRANEEAEALAAFLKRYPGSVRAPGAKSRLDNLGEKIE